MHPKIQKLLDEFPLKEGITQEQIDQLKSKTYSSGREIKIGDKIIFGLLLEYGKILKNRKGIFDTPYPLEESENTLECILKFIKFHPDEIGVLYEIEEETESMNKGNLIRLKNKIQ